MLLQNRSDQCSSNWQCNHLQMQVCDCFRTPLALICICFCNFDGISIGNCFRTPSFVFVFVFVFEFVFVSGHLHLPCVSLWANCRTPLQNHWGCLQAQVFTIQNLFTSIFVFVFVSVFDVNIYKLRFSIFQFLISNIQRREDIWKFRFSIFHNILISISRREKIFASWGFQYFNIIDIKYPEERKCLQA